MRLAIYGLVAIILMSSGGWLSYKVTEFRLKKKDLEIMELKRTIETLKTKYMEARNEVNDTLAAIRESSPDDGVPELPKKYRTQSCRDC